MASGRKKERSQLFIALGDLSKRIPVVKLERVEALYPTIQKVAHKPLVASDKTDEEKKKKQSNVHKEFEIRITGESDDCSRSMFPDNRKEDCPVDVSTSSEPPKKQYKLGKACDSMLPRASVPDQLNIVIEEGETADKNNVPQNYVVKTEVVTVECDPNALLTFHRSSESATDLPSLPENNGPVIRPETYSGNDVCGLYPQTYGEKDESKMNPPEFWGRNRPGTESLVFSGISGTGINIPRFSENNVPAVDSQISGNVRPLVVGPRFSVNNRQLAYSENNGSGMNPLSYSRDNVSGVNPSSYPVINRPLLNPQVYGGDSGSGINSSIYSGPGINPSTYPGNNGPGMNSPAYPGNTSHGINSVSYPVYSRPGYTPPVCSGNNRLGVNYLTLSGNTKSDLNPVYSGNNGMGINSLTYSVNRPAMLPLGYYGNNGAQTYSGTNMPGVNAQTFSGNNESGINTLAYSGNNGSTASSLSYCGNKEPGVNSQPYSMNSRVGLNSQTYPGNNGPGISSASFSGNSELGINSTNYSGSTGPAVNSSTYSGNRGTRMNSGVYSVTSGTGINPSAYAGNNGPGVNQVCKEMRFLGDSSFTRNEMAQQYEILQSYCQNSEPGIHNITCQDTIWSNDYITLNSLPSNRFQAVDCSQDFSYLFSCQVCGSMSAIVDELIKHWRLHTGVESLTCTACYVSFTDVLFLQAHWKAIHMGGVCSDSGVVLGNDPKFLQELVCEACGFAFSQFNALEQHVMSTHIPISHHRESMSWRSRNGGGSLYSVDNTQQNNVISSSKSPQNISLSNNNSLTKQFTTGNTIIGRGGHDNSVIQLQNNIMESNVAEHFMIRRPSAVVNNVTGTDVEISDDCSRTETDGESGAVMDVVETENQKLGDRSSTVDKGKVESVSSQNGKLFKCKVCGSNSYDVNELMKHWRIHIGANSITCTICKKTFSDLPFLQAHWRRSHMQGNPVQTSISRNNLLHNESSFLCETCGYAFPDFPLLEQHLLSTHVVAGSTHFPLKNRNSADNTQNVSHLHKQNLTIDKTKSCDLITLKIQVMNHCKKKDADKQPETKESQNTGIVEENTKKINNKYSDSGAKRTKNPSGCLVCGETSDDMIKHLVTHTGVLSLECCLCGKDFVDVPFLQAHWRATHMNGEVRHTNNGIYVGNYKENVSCKQKLLCETCGCYVPQFSALEKHIILTHTVIKPPYECKCDDVFSSEDELKSHISTCSW